MSARSSIGTLGVLLGCLYLIGAPVDASDEPSPSPSDVPTTSIATADYGRCADAGRVHRARLARALADVGDPAGN